MELTKDEKDFLDQLMVARVLLLKFIILSNEEMTEKRISVCDSLAAKQEKITEKEPKDCSTGELRTVVDLEFYRFMLELIKSLDGPLKDERKAFFDLKNWTAKGI